jgi:hypothetical protein
LLQLTRSSKALKAASVIASLSDEQLGRTGRYIQEAPEMSVQQWLERVLLGHIATHKRSIQETVLTQS